MTPCHATSTEVSSPVWVATVMRSSVGHRFTPLMVILGWIQRKSIGILLVYSVRFITDMTAHKCNRSALQQVDFDCPFPSIKLRKDVETPAKTAAVSSFLLCKWSCRKHLPNKRKWSLQCNLPDSARMEFQLQGNMVVSQSALWFPIFAFQEEDHPVAQTTPKMNTSQAQPGSSSQFASQLPQILVPGSIMLS